MCVIPGNVKATWIAGKVNSIGNSALYCTKKFEGNLQLSCKRKCDKYKKENVAFQADVLMQ